MTAALRMEAELDVTLRIPGHNEVARVMKEFGLEARIRRKCTYRVAKKVGELADGTMLENTLNRNFQQIIPDRFFVTDVTYIPTTEGWLYVSPILDLCTREIIACPVSSTQDLKLAFETIKALAKRKGAILLHSDQGYLYTSVCYRRKAEGMGISLSYSRRGNCWDNAVMENWNGVLKCEWLYHPDFRRHKQLLSAEDAKKEIREFVRYYNEERIQKGLGYRTPRQYREYALAGGPQMTVVAKIVLNEAATARTYSPLYRVSGAVACGVAKPDYELKCPWVRRIIWR